jgi:predicted Zn-dependent peptidase
MPELGEIKAGTFPTLQRASLDNGLEIVLASRPGADTVVMQAVIGTGYASDGDSPGLATLSMHMLDEGTTDMDALEISERLQFLGASLSTSAGLDYSEVRISTLRQSLSQSIALFADVLLSPAFPQDQLDRLKKEQHDAIQREKVTPMSMALRVVPRLLYGEGHRYAQPLTGNGFESSIAELTRDDVVAFHEKWIRPDNCILIVAGNVTMSEITAEIGAQLNAWEPGRPAVGKEVDMHQDQSGALFFLDRPGSLQSIVIGAYLVDPFEADSSLATDLLNDVLGGQFTSRINMKLREDKHWTYGARSLIVHTRERRPLMVYASVQMDKTYETIEEIRKEFTRLVGEGPVTQVEFDQNQSNTIMGLPGQWETNAAVARAVEYLLKLNLPDDYYRDYADHLQKLTVEEVRAIASDMVRPDALCWFVVGDRDKVLDQLKPEDFRKVVQIDSEGNVVGQ